MIKTQLEPRFVDYFKHFHVEVQGCKDIFQWFFNFKKSYEMNFYYASFMTLSSFEKEKFVYEKVYRVELLY